MSNVSNITVSTGTHHMPSIAGRPLPVPRWRVEGYTQVIGVRGRLGISGQPAFFSDAQYSETESPR